MPPSNKDLKPDRPPPEAARVTAETVTRAVGDRPAKVERTPAEIDAIVKDAMAIVRRFDSRPVLDSRSAEEILGHDEIGLPRQSSMARRLRRAIQRRMTRLPYRTTMA